MWKIPYISTKKNLIKLHLISSNSNRLRNSQWEYITRKILIDFVKFIWLEKLSHYRRETIFFFDFGCRWVGGFILYQVFEIYDVVEYLMKAIITYLVICIIRKPNTRCNTKYSQVKRCTMSIFIYASSMHYSFSVCHTEVKFCSIRYTQFFSIHQITGSLIYFSFILGYFFFFNLLYGFRFFFLSISGKMLIISFNWYCKMFCAFNLKTWDAEFEHIMKTKWE